MIWNYFKIAWRNLLRDKFYVVVNILGLSVGIGVCFIIAFYVQGELSYDTFHVKKDQVYRLTEERVRNEVLEEKSFTSYVLAEQIEADIPEVELKATVLGRSRVVQFKESEKVFPNNAYIHTESSFFDMFSFPLLIGDKETVLDDPSSVAISESLAKRIFGTTDIIGKTLLRPISPGEDRAYTISGIFEDVPVNSHMYFDAVFSFNEQLSTRISLDNSQFTNYILFKEGTNPALLTEKLSAASVTALSKEFVDHYSYQVKAQPLLDIYHSELYAPKTGNKNYIIIFGIIAVLILLIAIINYTNLAIARSGERNKEVGIRKVSGAMRTDLIKQFLGESVLYSLLAIPIALTLVDVSIPYFNSILTTEIQWSLNENYPLLFLVTILILITGLVSSFYPAFLLSTLKPSRVLKANTSNPVSKGTLFRRGLITIQFLVSSFLIISTITISKQLTFIQEKNLGFDQELLVSVELGVPTNRPNADVIKSEFLTSPAVISASNSFGSPGLQFGGLTVDVTLLSGSKNESEMQYVRADEHFATTFDLNIISGTDYKEDNLSMIETGALINESASKALGFSSPSEAIGKHVNTIYDKDKVIIGVVEDFHYQSVHTKIDPLIMVTTEKFYPFYKTLNIRLKPGNISNSIASLESEWKKLGTNTPLDFVFMDEAIGNLYQKEKNTSRLFNFFAAIAIIISSIGLLGLTAYSARRRTKEIGIRKVLGAKEADIVQLLSKDFLLLVLLGFIMAVPITWYLMNEWLSEFAYRIELEAGIFILSGVFAISIALLTVSWQSIKASLANPVESLKIE